jgi:hypothetical protein
MKRWLVVALMLVGCGQPDVPSTSDARQPDSIEREFEKHPVKMTVRINPSEPRLSDLVDMEVTVTAPREVEIKPPTFGDAVGDFLVLNYRDRSPEVASDSDSQTRQFQYQLEPVSSGTHLIRSVAIEFTDNRESSEAKGKTAFIESEPIELQVSTQLGDQTPDLANLEPMVDPVAIESPMKIWSILGALSTALIAAIAWIRRRRARQVETQVPQPTPEEIAQNALSQLLAEDLPGKGLFKDFYVRLTGIVRGYIEDTTGIKAPEQTTEEFLREIRSKPIFSVERSMRLAEFLEAADQVKYAGQQPGPDQIELSILRAKEFVFTAQ